MEQKLAPAIFLGKLSDFNSDISKNYFSEINEQFGKFSEHYFLFIELSEKINDKECQIRFNEQFQEPLLLQTLETILSKSNFNPTKQSEYSPIVQSYIEKLDLPKNKVVSIVVNEQNFQKLMELGQALVPIRNKNCSLVGLGNITHQSQTGKEITEAAKEFDSWVRVKLWEFDYYALRDIEVYFPFSKKLYLDKDYHYGSFLIIFGSLVGTDVLYDLFTGFTGNTSLRSFFFTTSSILRK